MLAGEKRSICISSSSTEVRRGALFCRNAISGAFPAATVHLLELALVEACNNIVQHAYRKQSGKPIWIEISREAQDFIFIIEDNAKPRSFSKTPDRNPESWKTVDEVPESGWGLYIINQIMDRVEFSRGRHKNRLRLTKTLSASEQKNSEPSEPSSAKSPSNDLVELCSKLENNELALTEMAGELVNAYERLNLFYTLSQDVNPLADEQELLERVLKHACECARAHWGALRLVNAGSLELQAVHGRVPEMPDRLPLIGTTVEQRVAGSEHEEVAFIRNGVAVMCLPIIGTTGFLGTLMLGGTNLPEGFLAGDVRLVRALADQAAVSLEVHRLYLEVVAAQLDRRELEIAHDLQQQLYPRDVPELPGIQLFAKGIAARQVGGDYLALLPRSDTELDFIIADAMGKGMSAAFFSVITHSAFRSILGQNPEISPGQLLTAFNHQFLPDFERFGMYMTAFCGRLDLRQQVLRYASAGHLPPFAAFADGNARFLETSDYMLGVDLDHEYRDFEFALQPGMKILCYTDGFTDYADGAGHLVGIMPFFERWRELILHSSLQEVCQQLMNEALTRNSSSGLQDDIALIGIESLK